MSIEHAKEEHFAEITAVWEDSVRATHHFLTGADIEALRPQIREEYLPAVDLRIYKEPSGAILGFIGVAGRKIEMLFIASAARGKGIGKSLVRYAIAEMDAAEVDVNEQNPEARGFYEHMGFESFPGPRWTPRAAPFRFCTCVWPPADSLPVRQVQKRLAIFALPALA